MQACINISEPISPAYILNQIPTRVKILFHYIHLREETVLKSSLRTHPLLHRSKIAKRETPSLTCKSGNAPATPPPQPSRFPPSVRWVLKHPVPFLQLLKRTAGIYSRTEFSRASEQGKYIVCVCVLLLLYTCLPGATILYKPHLSDAILTALHQIYP